MKCLLPTTMLLVVALLLPVVARGQDATEPPNGKKVLEKLAGEWKFTSAKGMSRTVKRELVLGGDFVQTHVFSDQGTPLRIKMYGYDARQKLYQAWWFTPGRVARAAMTMEFTGTWDEATKTLTLTAKKQGFTLVNTMTFLDEKTHATTITVTNADGKVVNRTEGKLVRQE